MNSKIFIEKWKITFQMVLLSHLSSSCFLFDPPIIYPEVTLMEIYNITDTSATFVCRIDKESNAISEGLWLILDTIKTNQNVYQLIAPQFFFAVDDFKKGDIDTLTILDLEGNTHYFSHLFYRGLFDVGGTYDELYKIIGGQKEFTTLP